MGTGGEFLRRLRARVEDEPTGFVWIENHSLAGTGYPASRSQVEWLTKNGIGSILSLTEEPLPKEWTEGFGLSDGHVPMRDHEPPSIDSMARAVGFIEEQLKAGRAVAVHCLAGEGRTGCVLSAYLIRSKGLDAGEALAKLRELKPSFVEHRQEKSVYDFAAKERLARRGV
jgi:atypical dual specificity phosphatase